MNILGDRYHVVSELGRGGCGVTYLAEDAHMPSRRKCVVKLLEPATKDPSAVAVIRSRFEREAAVLEALSESSDQIPTLYAYMSQDREFYLVQQYVEGPTLRQRIDAGGPLGEPEVRALLDGMLDVLRFVHDRQVIHRDVKPENIILRARDGRPVLIDFGAVKESVTTDLDAHGGSTSVAIGTPGYMPLEQAAGRPVYASDLYSLGATAIVALTGRRLAELVDRMSGDIAWRAHAPATSAALAAVLDRATEPRAHDRFRSADEMLAALHGESVPPTNVTPRTELVEDRSEATVPRPAPLQTTPIVVTREDTEVVPRQTSAPALASAPSATRIAVEAAGIASALLFAAVAVLDPIALALAGSSPHAPTFGTWSLQLALLGLTAIQLGNRRRHGVLGTVVGTIGAASALVAAIVGLRPGVWALLAVFCFEVAAVLAAVCWGLASRVPRRVAGAAPERYLLLGLFWATADLLYICADGKLSIVELGLFVLAIAGCALACRGGASATAAAGCIAGICLAVLSFRRLTYRTVDIVPYATAVQAVALAVSPVALWRSRRRPRAVPEP